MPATQPEQPNGARSALREIMAEYGPEALSRAATLSNVLKDVLPDDPRLNRMLVAAAEDRVADTLREHVAQGMDVDTGSRRPGRAAAGTVLARSGRVGSRGAKATGQIDRCTCA